MEVLVVVAIFSMVVVAIVNLFLLASRAQKKMETRERMQTAGQAIMDRITRDIRLSGVDYGVYAQNGDDLSQPRNVLHIGGQSRSYQEVASGCPNAVSTPCLAVTQTDPAGTVVTESMTPAGVILEQFSVWVTPEADPYTPLPAGGFAADVPTTVTVLLRLRLVGGDAAELQMQTTVTSRLYVR